MAKQHFYSRVPARVSMYNRADSFDTFAHSEGLDREFIERELAPVYENKLNKNDITVIRKGEMPYVYAQFSTKSGALVQNCIKFLPLDYTGERSAYLSHSLIYSQEEKERVLSGKEDTTLNPELFTAEIEQFDITATNAVPNSAYPETEYVPAKAQEKLQLIHDMDPETAKALLYAVLNSLCGKGKPVYVKLRGENETLSLRNVQLFNEVLAVLPYQLRGGLSFVSYVNDPTQYANFKLKGVSAQFPEVTATKGVYFDMKARIILGLQQDEVNANKALVNFFYSLLGNPALREEFLGYMERATAAVSGLQTLNLKTLSNLVFLFQCSCGLFPEREILPDDNMVYEYLCAYEKYRAALNEEYRMQAYKCLLRYPQHHIAIPKNIFAKVSRLYGGENRAAKRIFMNIVLELIHTDIMRDKLFTFIRGQYQAEDADMKATIIADLSRVFYGGFLQNQLLNFFSEQFAMETEETKSLIIEKLFLSIRTPAVQKKILEFIDQHYENMDEAHKAAFYDMVLEMLPECDELAQTLVQVVNHHITEDRKDAFAQRLIEALESDYHKKEHRLMPILAAHPGFCRDLVIKLAFDGWHTRKLHGEYLQWLQAQSVADKTAALVQLFELMPDLSEEAKAKLPEEAAALYQSDAGKYDLYLWLETADAMAALPEDLGAMLIESVVLPAVCQRVLDVFDTKVRTDGMTLLEAFAEKVPAVKDCEQYRVVDTYHTLLDAAQQLDYGKAVQCAEQLMQTPELLPALTAYLGRRDTDSKSGSPETVLMLDILREFMKSRKVQLDALYRKRVDSFSQQYYTEHGATADAAKAAQEASTRAMSLLLAVCQGLCRESEALNAQLCAPEAGVEAIASGFANSYGKGAAHWLSTQLVPDGGKSGFGSTMLQLVQAQKPAGGSFFSKLFGKKK